MVKQEIWALIRRRHIEEKTPIAELARAFDLDRKTVRRCLRQEHWQPYTRPERAETLLAPHLAFLQERAPQVNHSARILYQELVARHGYQGSYDTVKRFVKPLRATIQQAERALIRFETPPGLQSQIDWGTARVPFRSRTVVQHLFVLTLGYSRRSFYCALPDERMGQFLEAHERAFEHFGGHTREHLYDRPRTVCAPGEGGRTRWNPTFKSFADYWGFEPRLCAPYRAQTKGKVESGVKYVGRNFLPGRAFIDQVDFDEQLAEWTATVADLRIHGTTHERPLDRFSQEQPALIATAGQPPFQLAARRSRIVADDYLVSVATNRYSVPFALSGQTVEVLCASGQLQIFHRDSLVVTHPVLAGKYQTRILPEHGPGPIARNARLLRSSLSAMRGEARHAEPQVEIRDLSVYEALLAEVTP